MGDKESEKRLSRLEKTSKELDARLAKLEKTVKRAVRSGEKAEAHDPAQDEVPTAAVGAPEAEAQADS